MNNKQDALRYIIKNHFIKVENVILAERLFEARLLIDWIYKQKLEKKVVLRYIQDLERYLRGELKLDWINGILPKERE